MTVKKVSLTGASSADTHVWDAIDWRTATSSVKRLQMRIAKAEREGRHNKVKTLQWLLTHSFYAKALAVKRVTQNQGSRTPGTDGELCRTPAQKMQLTKRLQRKGYQALPLRRIYIPKKSNPTEKRPLSIPTIKDRAMQALHLLGLEPVAELRADPNAYGFRPYRCVADAVEQCFKALSLKHCAGYILEGDIRKCFDSIDTRWLQNFVPMDKKVLGQWLNASYMERNALYTTVAGTPQGGIASPCLALMTLSGLENAVKASVKRRDKVNVVIYADDFIVTGASKEVLEQKVKPAVAKFLQERGLELSETKTKISTVENGFNFLGHHIRKYNGKLLIKPAKENVKTFLNETSRIIRKYRGKTTADLITRLNPKIRGWANYYRHVVSKQVFSYVDDCIYRTLAKWVKRRHPNKNRTWWRNNYFRSQGLRNWVFFAKDPKEPEQTVDLLKMSATPIKRHVKVKGEATPYDPKWTEYFKARRQKYFQTKRPKAAKKPKTVKASVSGTYNEYCRVNQNGLRNA